MKLTNCRACGSKNLMSVLDLGHQPWCNDLLNKIGDDEKIYPLHLIVCNECELLQLDYTVSKETMFSSHGYRSGMTQTLINHFLEVAQENKEMFNLKEDDLIIDIGGNDGTQLLQYKKLGIKNCINVESATNISNISKNVGINTINGYFNEDLVKNSFVKNSAKLINAAGVFFHLEELHSVIKGINYVLSNDGILNIQCMYAAEMIKKNTFDMIYHEHLCYYTLKSLQNLLKLHNLDIFDAYYSPIHSGSLIVRACKNNFYKKTDRYFVTYEEDKNYTIDKFLVFSSNIKNNKGKIRNYLKSIKGKIYAYGSPAKGNTLLNYEEIDNTLIEKAVEINELKIGKILPMSHIPISKESDDDVPDYYLLLSHNFLEEILLKNKNKNCKFIVPFPTPRIIK